MDSAFLSKSLYWIYNKTNSKKWDFKFWIKGFYQKAEKYNKWEVRNILYVASINELMIIHVHIQVYKLDLLKIIKQRFFKLLKIIQIYLIFKLFEKTHYIISAFYNNNFWVKVYIYPKSKLAN